MNKEATVVAAIFLAFVGFCNYARTQIADSIRLNAEHTGSRVPGCGHLMFSEPDNPERKNRDLCSQNEYLTREINAAHDFNEIIGQSPALHAVLDQIKLVARTDSTVLLLGETGTGKELIARAVHFFSPHKNRPLIKVNCAALPAGLIDSWLFGHEKGSFHRCGKTAGGPL